MADTKLLGTLELSLGTIEDTINKANQALQKLGKGVNLDLTDVANERVKRITQTVKQAQQSMSNMSTKIVSPTSITNLERVNQALKTTTVGYDELGRKVREVSVEGSGIVSQSITQQLTQARKESDRLGNSIMNWMGRMIMYRGLRKMWTEAKSFATDYYATLNEIQVVTMKSDAQVQAMAKNFTGMSQSLRAPMTDIANAATIFYRQGLGDEAVNTRLEALTKFSKISGTNIEDAAQYFTAVLNSFDELEGNAQRVSDVFTYIGDNAATSGQEIATAMQRAAATAQAAGMGFEFLSAAIATVSANTRQSAETIGTAFNSMMARLHSIRTTGYNQEDETKVNDVAKALKTVGIELMNSQGEWQDFDQILTTLSKKWTTLNDKQRSYIATTLAGVRAQNYFLSLMQDMSKGIEGGSQMWELYNGAMEAAGITDQKYEVYLDGITAAQDRLTAAVQNFYDLAGSGTFFTGMFNNLASFVEMINNATQATQGLNMAIPVTAAAIGMLVTAFSKLAAIGSSGMVAAVMAHPFIAITTAAVAAVVAISAVVNAITSSQTPILSDIERIDGKIQNISTSLQTVRDKQKEWTDKASDLESLKQQYIELSTNSQRTAEQNAQLESVIKQITSAVPGLASAIGQGTEAFAYQQQVVDGLNASIREYMRLGQLEMQKYALSSGFQEAAQTQADIAKARRSQAKAKTARAEIAQFMADNADALFGLSQEEQINRWLEYKSAQTGREQHHIISEYAEQFGVNAEFAGGNDPYKNLVKAYFDTDESTLKARQDKLNQQVRDMLYGFVDTTGLTGELLERAQADIENTLQQIWDDDEADWTTEGAYRDAALTMQKASEKWNQIQREVSSDAELATQQFKIDEAKRKFDEARAKGDTAAIEQSAKEYNDAVDAFNTRYKEIDEGASDVFQHISDDAINAAKSVNDVAESTKTVKDEIAEAKRIQEARKSGFSEQVSNLDVAAGLGGQTFNRGKFKEYLQTLEREDPALYRAMQESEAFNTFTGKLFDEEDYEESALKGMWDVVKDGWIDAGKAVTDYGNQVTETMTGAGAQDVAAGLLSLWDPENQQASTQAMIDYITSLPDQVREAFAGENEDFLSALFGEDFNFDDWQTQFAEMVDGTAEHFGTLAEAIAETGSSSQETIGAIDTLMEYLSQSENIENLAGSWEKLTKEQQKALKALGVDKKEFEGLKEGSKALKDLQNNLRRLKVQNLEKMGKVLSGTSDAYDSLVAGTKEYTKFLPTLNQQINKTKQMQDAYDTVVDKSKEGTDEYTEALNTLASATGLTAEQLQTSGGMAQALAQLDGQAEITWGTIEALAGTLLSMSGITFDPSMISNGYLALGDSAVGAAGQVMELVNAALSLLGASISFTPDGKGGGKFNVTGVKGSGSSKSSKGGKGGGGGGGGGGGKDKDTFSSRLQQLEKQMSRSVDKYKDMLDRLSLYESRFEDQGELTNVLRVLEQRRQVLIEQQEAYNQILKDMPNLIQQAKNELSKYGAGTEEYTTALGDLQNLEDAYASYTSELIKNRTEQLQNADAIKETREAIVKLEGSLRNTIQAAIMERNEREAASLDARVNMENEILDAIVNRYEKERQEIQETTDLRIKALDKETDALSDALDKRRQLAEDEDKQAKLTELQDQYARIVADPTRVKEAQDIAKKISDLQEEMAWDAAEREVEAQQKAIEQQTESLEDYQTFIDKYYDALIEDPRNFMDEYNEILSKSDAEIINWLSNNSDAYLKATDAAREQLRQGWQDTMDELRMYTRTVWDEVEAIMQLGDEGILNFLVNNSQEFREANAFDQADMVYEWKEMLEDWHSAYKDTFQNLDYLDFTNSVYDWVTYLISEAKAKSGGGGGGGATTTLSPAAQALAKSGSSSAAAGALAALGGELFGGILNGIGNQVGTWIVSAINNKGNTISAEISATTEKSAIEMFKMKKASSGPFSNIRASKKFAEGGILNYTGPAWVDGSKERPERILNAHQTQAFDTLVDWLTTPKLNFPGLTAGMGPTLQGAGSPVTFGDINIEVDSLDSDTDIDNLADKLMEAINNRMLRGMAIGGGITTGF